MMTRRDVDCTCDDDLEYTGEERRRFPDLNRLHERLDKQNDILLELGKKLDMHLEAEAQIAPALQDIVTLWKGSKLIIPIVAGIGMTLGALWTLIAWVKDHLR